MEEVAYQVHLATERRPEASWQAGIARFYGSAEAFLVGQTHPAGPQLVATPPPDDGQDPYFLALSLHGPHTAELVAGLIAADVENGAAVALAILKDMAPAGRQLPFHDRDERPLQYAQNRHERRRLSALERKGR